MDRITDPPDQTVALLIAAYGDAWAPQVPKRTSSAAGVPSSGDVPTRRERVRRSMDRRI